MDYGVSLVDRSTVSIEKRRRHADIACSIISYLVVGNFMPKKSIVTKFCHVALGSPAIMPHRVVWILKLTSYGRPTEAGSRAKIFDSFVRAEHDRHLLSAPICRLRIDSHFSGSAKSVSRLIHVQ